MPRPIDNEESWECPICLDAPPEKNSDIVAHRLRYPNTNQNLFHHSHLSCLNTWFDTKGISEVPQCPSCNQKISLVSIAILKSQSNFIFWKNRIVQRLPSFAFALGKTLAFYMAFGAFAGWMSTAFCVECCVFPWISTTSFSVYFPIVLQTASGGLLGGAVGGGSSFILFCAAFHITRFVIDPTRLTPNARLVRSVLLMISVHRVFLSLIHPIVIPILSRFIVRVILSPTLQILGLECHAIFSKLVATQVILTTEALLSGYSVAMTNQTVLLGLGLIHIYRQRP